MIKAILKARVFVTVGVLLGSTSNLSHADLGVEIPSANVSIGILGTFGGSATKPAGAMIMDIGVGRSESTLVAVTPCDGTTFTFAGPVAASLPTSHHVWEANIAVQKAGLESIELGIDWKRFDPKLGPAKPAASGSQVVSLNEGDYQLLDFQSLVSSATSNCSEALTNVALKVEASLTEDPAFKDRRIDYELWLVHEGQGGRRERVWRVTGRHGEKQEFDFSPLSQALEGSRWPDTGQPIVVETHVGGHIRGRYRPDGRLDLALLAFREFRVANNGGWANGERGQKLVRAAPEDVIQLELPVTSWRQIQQSPQADRKPMRGEEEVRSFLQAQKVSLILKVTPSS